jgi:hypothetical protein
MMKIGLTKGKHATVDDSDYDALTEWNWYAKNIGVNWYACRNSRVDGERTLVYMHRHLLDNPDGCVDHKDRDGLNNSRDNLRAGTHRQNCQNNGRGNLVGTQMTPAGRYVAQIYIDGDRVHLGVFATQDEASTAYADASAKIGDPVHGQSH